MGQNPITPFSQWGTLVIWLLAKQPQGYVVCACSKHGARAPDIRAPSTVFVLMVVDVAEYLAAMFPRYNRIE